MVCVWSAPFLFGSRLNLAVVWLRGRVLISGLTSPLWTGALESLSNVAEASGSWQTLRTKRGQQFEPPDKAQVAPCANLSLVKIKSSPDQITLHVR